MAKAHIQEYRELSEDGFGYRVPVGKEPAAATQAVTYTTATQSAAFGSSTTFIRVIADADAYLAFGDNPTADNDGMYLPVDTAEYFGVVPGTKVSVYDGTS